MALTSGRTIKVGGTSTAFSAEPTTKVTANTVYQITDATKRVLDPSIAVLVEVDADGAGAGGYATASASSYTIDYLFGTITFLADQGASALVRVSGNYLPMVALAKVTDSKVSVARDAPDATTMDSGSYRNKAPTLIDVQGSITSLELANYDHDPGAGSIKLRDLLVNGTPFIYEESGGGQYFRAWVCATSVEHGNTAVGELTNTTINFYGCAQRGTTSGTTTAGCGWGT
jgi:hypothetical protein